MSKTIQKSLDDFLREGLKKKRNTERLMSSMRIERPSRPSSTRYMRTISSKATPQTSRVSTVVTNTAVRMTSPDGAKMTLWVGSVEQNIFHEKISHWEKQGHSLPVVRGRDQQTHNQDHRYRRRSGQLEPSERQPRVVSPPY